VINFSKVIGNSEVDDFITGLVYRWLHGFEAIIVSHWNELSNLTELSFWVFASVNFENNSVSPDFISNSEGELFIDHSIVTESSIFNVMNFLELIFFVGKFFVVDTPIDWISLFNIISSSNVISREQDWSIESIFQEPSSWLTVFI
jgi:hypothetical protein